MSKPSLAWPGLRIISVNSPLIRPRLTPIYFFADSSKVLHSVPDPDSKQGPLQSGTGLSSHPSHVLLKFKLQYLRGALLLLGLPACLYDNPCLAIIQPMIYSIPPPLHGSVLPSQHNL